MAVEIERKFLVADDSWQKDVVKKIPMRQRYFPFAGENHPSGRIRITGEKAFLTLKTCQTGCGRGEYEYELPMQDAEEIFQKICTGPAIEKVRNIVMFGGFKWEIDVFSGDNSGLTVAEIELKTPDQLFERPAWLGCEITLDYRYTNASLARSPYKNWRTFDTTV